MKILENKVAVITGSGSGIGKATALLFAKEGAKVVVSDIVENQGKAVADEIAGNGGKSVFIRADTSKPEDHQSLVEQIVKKFGGLDIAVNNAGIGGPIGPIAEYPLDGWRKVIDINLSGVFYGLRFQIPAMIQRGGGSIVNMASILGQVGTKFSCGYVSAKHGVVGLTKAAALEYADKNIRVNCVGPGYIRTPLLTNALDKPTMDALVGLHPMGRLGEADEIAEFILWLVSPKSSFATGSFYALDGGYLAQ